MRKIVYITGTRADYGLMKSILFAIRRHPKLKLELIVTGMHLMPEFGNSISEIKKEGFKFHQLKAVYKKDNRDSMAEFVGQCTAELVEILKKVKPNFIMLLGDRGEMLAGAIAGLYMGIPVVHLHGGEITSTVDEIARHAITKLSALHFPATPASAKRIERIGEEKWRIKRIEAPSFTFIKNKKFLEKEKAYKKFNPKKKKIILVAQHSVSTEIEQAPKQMKETMESLKKVYKIDSNIMALIIYPNADTGGRKMIKIIEKYRKYPFIKIYKNLPYEDYLGLMNIAFVMVGNSSSGIIEAPSFHLPIVNIGTRQEGRERSTNVIDVGYDKKQIIKAIKKALYDKKFRARVKKCKNSYGGGKTGKEVANILAKIKINQELLQKKLTY